MRNITLLLIILCSFNFGYGQSIFLNAIIDPDPSASDPFTTGQMINTNISVSGIGRGPDVFSSSAVDRYSARDWDSVGLDANDYFEFILTPTLGFVINFSSLTYTGQVSGTGPTSIAIRSSLDVFTSDIGTPNLTGSVIDLSAAAYQNITASTTFRIYAWGASSSVDSFSINDFDFQGTVISVCTSTVSWDGATWTPAGPDVTTSAIIDGNYNTGTNGNITACSLVVNTNRTLTVADNSFLEIENDITVDGTGAINVQKNGSVIQNSATATTTITDPVNGLVRVTKETAPINNWYEYTYWSPPVSGETIGDTFFGTNSDRRYLFNAANYEDATMETANNNAAVAGQDDVDDNGDDWQLVSAATVMQPGVGYACTLSPTSFVIAGIPYAHIFEGPFNNGTINVPIVRNDATTADTNWNFIGNPYPSAIAIDAFFNDNVTTSGILDGALYLWSQNTAPTEINNGNSALNFDTSDYAVINGTGEAAGGDGVMPNRFIPSGQGFFISFSDAYATPTGNVVFSNAMRVTGGNDQFFKNTTSDNSNKLWLNLISDNGIKSQILIGYVDGATNENDGMYYDATRNLSTGMAAFLYSTIDGSNKKFSIQGKAPESLTIDEEIPLGLYTSITIPTLYSVSVAQLQGDFFTNNSIYLEDTVMNTVYNLSNNDYTFTSTTGEFNDRFKIVFKANTLSTDEFIANSNNLSVIEQQNDNVKFSIASQDSTIKSVKVFDLLGRELYRFNGTQRSEIFNLSHLSSTAYIVQVALSNGRVISKKAIKK